MNEAHYRVGEFLVILACGWALVTPHLFYFFGMQGGMWGMGNAAVSFAVGCALPTIGEWRWGR